MKTIGEQINEQHALTNAAVAYISEKLYEIEERLKALENPKPPPDDSETSDVPWKGQKFVEIDSAKISQSWYVADGAEIPGWEAKLRLPPHHMPPETALSRGIVWHHNPEVFNHSQLRIAVGGKRGKYMSSAIPWYIQPDRTYGFSFDFTYSEWPLSWVNIFQLYGYMAEGTQKDVVALFHKNGGLVCHCYDEEGDGRGSDPITVAAGQTRRVALQVRSGLRRSHVIFWLQRLDKSWWKIWSFENDRPLGLGELMQEPDALLDVRFGPYSDSPIKRVVYDRIQYWLVDE